MFEPYQIKNKVKYYLTNFLSNISVQQLQILIEKIVSYNRIQEKWRKAIMEIMHEKGDPKESDFY